MLKNKTALVTGSTSGIGLGIAKALARQGANVMLNGFGNVEEARAEVAAFGTRVSSPAFSFSLSLVSASMAQTASSSSALATSS